MDAINSLPETNAVSGLAYMLYSTAFFCFLVALSYNVLKLNDRMKAQEEISDAMFRTSKSIYDTVSMNQNVIEKLIHEMGQDAVLLIRHEKMINKIIEDMCLLQQRDLARKMNENPETEECHAESFESEQY